MEKVRKILYNIIMAMGIFLFWTVVILLLGFREELIQFLKEIYLTGTVKSLVAIAVPVGITVAIVRLDK